MMIPNDKAIKAAIRYLEAPMSAREQMEKILTAAYAAQFQSEDYAGLVKWLRDKAESLSEIYPPEAEAADALEAVLAERDTYKNWLDNYEKQFAAKVEELVTVRLERDALLARNKRLQETLSYWNDTYKYSPANEQPPILEDAARLAPVDDKALEAKAAAAIIAVEHNGIDDEFILEARAAISAIRPHIEAAERERCAKIAETPELWVTDKPSRGCDDIAAAIRSGK